MQHSPFKSSFTKKQTTRLQLYEAKVFLRLNQAFRLNFQFVDVIERSVELRCLFSVVGAVEITLARLDRHHHPPEGLSVFAPKMDGHCPGPVWPAALSV